MIHHIISRAPPDESSAKQPSLRPPILVFTTLPSLRAARVYNFRVLAHIAIARYLRDTDAAEVPKGTRMLVTLTQRTNLYNARLRQRSHETVSAAVLISSV